MSEKDEHSDLPSGWQRVQLGSLGTWGSGGTPKRTVPAYYGGDIPWLKIGDLDDGPVYSAQTSITPLGLADSSAKLIPAGTLLVAMYGSIGKLGITRFECATNQAIAHLRVEESLSSVDFIRFALLRYRQELIQLGKGGAQQNISQTVLKKFEIELPPLPEQRQIVDALEAAFADLDAGIAAIEAAQRDLERYRRSVLKAAVGGALTADWRRQHPNVEPASALLERVLIERRERWEADQLEAYEAKGKTPPDGWRKRYKPPVEPKSQGLPGLPAGWHWASTAQLSREGSVTYGVIKLGTHRSDGVPTLRSSNVRPLYLDLEGIKRIDPDLSAQYSRTVLRGGDVVLTVRGTLGGVAVAPSSMRGYNVSREVAVIRPLGAVIPEFIAFSIASDPIQNWLLSRARGIAYTGINLSTLAELPIPLPSEAEQEAIIQAVEERLCVADAAAAELESQRIRADRLRQAVLKRAFAGELVPQDPTDEPASVLLGRVQKELAERKKTPTPRKRKRTMSTPEPAPAASLVEIVEADGPIEPRDLWKRSGIESIDAFYADLKTEVETGLLTEQVLSPTKRMIVRS